jgi:hypothetical protein
MIRFFLVLLFPVFATANTQTLATLKPGQKNECPRLLILESNQNTVFPTTTARMKVTIPLRRGLEPLGVFTIGDCGATARHKDMVYCHFAAVNAKKTIDVRGIDNKLLFHEAYLAYYGDTYNGSFLFGCAYTLKNPIPFRGWWDD